MDAPKIQSAGHPLSFGFRFRCNHPVKPSNGEKMQSPRKKERLRCPACDTGLIVPVENRSPYIRCSICGTLMQVNLEAESGPFRVGVSPSMHSQTENPQPRPRLAGNSDPSQSHPDLPHNQRRTPTLFFHSRIPASLIVGCSLLVIMCLVFAIFAVFLISHL